MLEIWLVLLYRIVELCVLCVVVFCQAEDGIRYLVRSRGLGDVYKRQVKDPIFISSCGKMELQ